MTNDLINMLAEIKWYINNNTKKLPLENWAMRLERLTQQVPSDSGRTASEVNRDVQSAAHRDCALSIPELVEVTWRDCQTLEGWICAPDAFEVMENRRIIRTVGYVMKRTDDQMILASSWEEMFGKICGTWGIPCEQILSVRTITKEAASTTDGLGDAAD